MAHTHPVVDADPRYIIDPVTRAIKLPEGTAEKVIMRGDHKSERLGFSIPKTIDGHDMSLCNRVEVHFTNYSGSGATAGGVCLAEDLAVSGDNVTCSWLIPGDCTGIDGNLDFSLSFICTDGMEISYAWGTDEYTGLKVKPKRNHSKTIEQNPPDILEAVKQDIAAQVVEELQNSMGGLPDPAGYDDGTIMVVRDSEWIPTALEEVKSELLETGDPTIIGAINENKRGIEEHQAIIEELQQRLE